MHSFSLFLSALPHSLTHKSKYSLFNWWGKALVFIPWKALGNCHIALSRETFSIFRITPQNWNWQERGAQEARACMRHRANNSLGLCSCCIPDTSVRAYVCLCIAGWAVRSKQQEEKEKGVIPHHYLLYFPGSSHWGRNRFETGWVANITATWSLVFQSVHGSPLSEELSPNAFTFLPLSREASNDCRGLWEILFENKCRGLAKLPEPRPSPFKSR